MQESERSSAVTETGPIDDEAASALLHDMALGQDYEQCGPRPASHTAPPEGRSPVSMPSVAGAQVLVRALNLMFLLRDQSVGVSTAELVAALDLPQANVYRLLQTLENAGLVDRDLPGRVRLGLGLLDLSSVVHTRIDEEIEPVALPLMRSLTRELEQTSLLTMRAGLSAVCVQSVESSRPIRLSYSRGRLVPLLGGASGRVLLPWLPDRTLRHILAQRTTWQMAPSVDLTADELHASLLTVRAAGYVVSHGEVDPNVTAVAAPVLSPDGRLFAGLSVAGPSEQFPEERLPAVIDAVRDCAAELGSRL